MSKHLDPHNKYNRMRKHNPERVGLIFFIDIYLFLNIRYNSFVSKY